MTHEPHYADTSDLSWYFHIGRLADWGVTGGYAPNRTETNLPVRENQVIAL